MRPTLLSLVFLLLSAALGQAFTTTLTPVGPTGKRAAIDLPAYMHQQNSGGSDTEGLCVFTSGEVAGWGWQNLDALHGFQKWMEQYPGGGWPDKFDSMLKAYCKSRSIPVPKYIQHLGGDEGFLELAVKTRRAACVTYAGMDNFYRGDIAHMVVLGDIGADSVDENSCILDNNRPGRWVWMTRQDLSVRWHKNTAGKGWAVVFLSTPPPPGEDRILPAPKPRPNPRPWRPLRPFWRTVRLVNGETLYKLYDGVKFLGVWEADGWHEALTEDGWSVHPQGLPPLPRPGGNRYFTNGGQEVSADYFADDSGFPYVTVVVKDATERAALLKALPAGAGDRVHLNVFLPDWWAAKREKNPTTAQDSTGKVLWTSDKTDVDTVLAAIKAALPAPAPQAPTPTPVAPEPKPAPLPAPPTPVLPPAPMADHRVTVPLGAFWGTVVTFSLLGVRYVCSR